MQTQITNEFTISENGYYGNFGGAYIPELLYKNVKELTDNYLKITEEPNFKKELNLLLHDYVGRPTPLYFAKNLSVKYNAKIYLKREDLNHTGSHKINNALGQALLAKKLGKQKNYCRNRCWSAWCGNSNCLCAFRTRLYSFYGRGGYFKASTKCYPHENVRSKNNSCNQRNKNFKRCY